MKYILSFTSFLLITISVYAQSSDGIIVFTMPGCSRCEYTINYLKEHKIEFTEYSTEIESNNARMWSVIEESGNPESDRITMPVVVVDGIVSYSIENLEEFLKKISGGR